MSTPRMRRRLYSKSYYTLPPALWDLEEKLCDEAEQGGYGEICKNHEGVEVPVPAGVYSPQLLSPAESITTASPLSLDPFQRCFIFHLEPSPGTATHAALADKALSIKETFGIDSTHHYHPHCSVSSFFAVRHRDGDQIRSPWEFRSRNSSQHYLLEYCEDYINELYSGESTPSHSSDESQNESDCRLSALLKSEFLDFCAQMAPKSMNLEMYFGQNAVGGENGKKDYYFNDKYPSLNGGQCSVYSQGVLETPCGSVLVPLSFPLLTAKISSFCARIENVLSSTYHISPLRTSDDISQKIRPKRIDHISLASKRSQEVAKQIADSYRETDLKLEDSSWDFVLYELIPSSDEFVIDGSHKLKEIARAKEFAKGSISNSI